MTPALAAARPGAAAGRATFTALAARETRRFARNPVFLSAVAIIVAAFWAGPRAGGTKDTGFNSVTTMIAIFLGGFGMMATFGLTRSMRASEPVAGVTPVTRPARTAALCAAAIVPFGCGCLTLLAFVHFHPAGGPAYGAFGPPARIAVLAGQIVVPALGGPLLGIALGRWVRFPGAAFVLCLLLWAWVSVVTILSESHPDSAAAVVLRLLAPFAFFTRTRNAGGVTAWHGPPWSFLGWQLALCAIAVLAALLRGAEGPARARIIRALAIAGAAALILLALTAAGGIARPVTA